MLVSVFDKIAGLKTCNFTKKRLQPRCFPVNIANTYFEEHLQTATFIRYEILTSRKQSVCALSWWSLDICKGNYKDDYFGGDIILFIFDSEIDFSRFCVP